MRLCLVVFFLLFQLIDSYNLEISLGQLKGKDVATKTGKKAFIFKKVPFVEPPVGQLRFALPQPKTPWSGIWDSTEYGPACMTNMSVSHSVPKWVDEDCLHLNIFSSESCLKTKSCPVVFYMHGGSLMMDSAVMFDDQKILDNFAERDVVMVIAAFRLGIFASLTFNSDDVVPRNLALYDMVAGLEFIQREITHFGGNPKELTVMGHSGGAEQVLHLTFSRSIDPHKRLFQRSISMSPAQFFGDIQRSIDMSWEFIKRVNCSITHHPLNPEIAVVKEAVECLRKVDQMELLRIQRQMEEEVYFNNRLMLLPPLLPAIDVVDFYSNPPIARPLMIGSVLHEIPDEGMWHQQNSRLSNYKFNKYDNPLSVLQKYNEDFYSNKLGEKFGYNHSHISQTVFLAVHAAGHGMRKAGGNSFVYSYENPTHSVHTDDLFYLLGVHAFEMNEDEKKLQEYYVETFVNFIKNGVPDDKWQPLEEKIDNYMHIDVNISSGLQPEMRDHYNKKVIDYWLKELMSFDKNLTSQKKTSNSVSMRSAETSMSETWQIEGEKSTNVWSWIQLVLVFLIGMFVGSFVLRENPKKTEYSVIYGEKVPLL